MGAQTECCTDQCPFPPPSPWQSFVGERGAMELQPFLLSSRLLQLLLQLFTTVASAPSRARMLLSFSCSPFQSTAGIREG